jgi:hypothetical protein
MMEAEMEAEMSSAARGFGAPPPDDQAEEQPNATPEEQAQYTAFVENVLELVYGDKGGKRLQATLKALKASDDPVQDLAATTATLVKRVEDSAQGAEMELADGVVYHAGVAVLEDLAELAGKAGIHDFSEEEMEQAGYRAIDAYRMMKGDQVDEDKAGADLAEMMNQDPKLAEMVTQLSQQTGKPVPQAKPSVNPQTGAEEFYDVGGGDDRDSGRDLDMGGRTGDAASAGTADGGSIIDQAGDLLGRALDSIGAYANEKMGAEKLGGTIAAAGFGGALGPGGALVGMGVDALGRANNSQIAEAEREGTWNNETETGTRTGLMGESVAIGRGAGGAIGGQTGSSGGRGDARGGAEIDPTTGAPKEDLSRNYRTPARARSPVAAAAMAPRRARGFAFSPTI